MTVQGLINVLSLVKNKDADVKVFWDGSDRGTVEGIFVHSGDDWTDAGTIVIVGEWSVYESDIRGEHKVIYSQ